MKIRQKHFAPFGSDQAGNSQVGAARKARNTHSTGAFDDETFNSPEIFVISNTY